MGRVGQEGPSWIGQEGKPGVRRMAPLLATDEPLPISGADAAGEAGQGGRGHPLDNRLGHYSAPSPAARAEEQVLFSCGHCLGWIPESDPVYMRRDATFCSQRCRHRGLASAAKPVLGASPEQPQACRTTRSGSGAETPAGWACAGSPATVGLSGRTASLSQLSALCGDGDGIAASASAARSRDDAASTYDSAGSSTLGTTTTKGSDYDENFVGIPGLSLMGQAMGFGGSRPRLFWTTAGLLITKLATLVARRGRGGDEAACGGMGGFFRPDNSFTFAEKATAATCTSAAAGTAAIAAAATVAMASKTFSR